MNLLNIGSIRPREKNPVHVKVVLPQIQMNEIVYAVFRNSLKRYVSNFAHQDLHMNLPLKFNCQLQKY